MHKLLEGKKTIFALPFILISFTDLATDTNPECNTRTHSHRYTNTASFSVCLGPPPGPEISSLPITVTSGELSGSGHIVLPEADVFHRFWKVPCCSLNMTLPLFAFASSSKDYYRSLRPSYSSLLYAHVTLSSTGLSVLHSGLMPQINSSTHRFSLQPCLSNTLICHLRFLKIFDFIFRDCILVFSNIPDPEYCFFSHVSLFAYIGL